MTNVVPNPSLCQDSFMFCYKRKIRVYETDLMGIVHHSNYLRFFEEARIEWCIFKGFTDTSNEAVYALTVHSTRVLHKKPLRYGDEFSIVVQARAVAARFVFQYRLLVNNETCVLAETIHCALSSDYKPKRLPAVLLDTVKDEQWIETWL